ncbi:hypothetical protein SA496_11665 [Pseudomonas sp. JS3066]|jgi:hypothetical protein|uniref:hypothetical protein n=1 Tax=unclassified Pseudomonas TaxID=196821 RepID=UPI000EA9D0FF|nr:MULTISPECIES: hypothetical protein [unclassified Pseudomonas]AYF86742.1 hypothetical protein D6Z43_06055 [Pseudomonas sp. DY-1]MDH4653644.1 hypothetical protein [Pseudomonas sp. BN606]MRK22009.1 hypothetical protein [Pseudomonas sp. JG-B]WVK95787.1 hypothetical protein SA496_11665 [Pseudomonas sp. JS3066]
MSTKTLFLISYILDNQPRSVEVESDAEAMTPDQARYYLGSIHTSSSPEAFTDVQVTRISHPKMGGPTPAHNLQP